MVRQSLVLPNLIQQWYGSCRAVRADGAAYAGCYRDRDRVVKIDWLRGRTLQAREIDVYMYIQ